jgi:putative Mg2+ transporter-C (MgtC) family protein
VIASGAVFSQPLGQGWAQAGELALAFGLSSMIGFERELRQKSAGLRTHTIVGVASALIMLVSKFGFADVLATNVKLDPSRVAAQIVSGIGFIGGGLIFVRRDAVRGLTTAAVVWLTAAVGMAAGAGLPVLAVLVTAGHFVVVFVYTPLAARLPRSKYTPTQISATYVDGQGVLRQILVECTERGFTVSRVSMGSTVQPWPLDGAAAEQYGDSDPGSLAAVGVAVATRAVSVALQIHGRGSLPELVAALSDIDGVLTVNAGEPNGGSE